MALKVTRKQVDELERKHALFFHALTDHEFTRAVDVCNQMNRAGHPLTIEQACKLGAVLVERGFASERRNGNVLSFRRATIVDTAKAAEPALVRQLIGERLGDMADTLAELALAVINIEVALAKGTPVDEEELAELRQKAANWDDLQKLMGRGK